MNSRQLFRDHESMLSGSSAALPIAPNGLVWLAGGGGAVAAEAALAQREGRLVQCEKLLPMPGAGNGGERQGQQAKQETARGLGSFQRSSFVDRVVAAAVSRSCACIGSPCLRHCVHGASIPGQIHGAAARR
eukprot:COSAG01_NODE_9162_length_2532_cov_2.386354_2_plen_132_part_00